MKATALMASTTFVTGSTGLTAETFASNSSSEATRSAALVRNPDEAAALAEIGVELVQGDIAEADDVVRQRPRAVTPSSTARLCSVGPARPWPTSRPST